MEIITHVSLDTYAVILKIYLYGYYDMKWI